MARDKTHDKGTSLAKGPTFFVGLILLAFGILAFVTGSDGFTQKAVDGTVNGERLFSLEMNGWSALLTAAAGLLLLIAAPLHWGAKTMSLIVGLVLGAASLITLVDGDDVFGIFAGNGKTALAWGITATVLLVLALLPRVGGGDKVDRDHDHDHDGIDDRGEARVGRRRRSGSVAAGR